MSNLKSKSKILPEAERRLKNLSRERLIVANDFLSYLENRESSEATEELLNLPGFEESFHNAVQQADSGKVIRFDTVRRDV
ncbi:MAG TPA: hypothetical protein ENI61_01260 [Ignavibacteria bacterium]|nr:hypothetical protein [Ignavibacteria bacterium]